MYPTSPNNIEASLRMLSEFKENQANWLKKAERAYSKGFFIEAIELCLQQIHAILRRGLWLQAQKDIAEEKGAENEYTKFLLTHPLELLPSTVRDQELTAAAMRYEFLDPKTGEELVKEQREIVRIMRAMVSSKGDTMMLKSHAETILAITHICLQTLSERLEMLRSTVIT